MVLGGGVPFSFHASFWHPLSVLHIRPPPSPRRPWKLLDLFRCRPFFIFLWCGSVLISAVDADSGARFTGNLRVSVSIRGYFMQWNVLGLGFGGLICSIRIWATGCLGLGLFTDSRVCGILGVFWMSDWISHLKGGITQITSGLS